MWPPMDTTTKCIAANATDITAVLPVIHTSPASNAMEAADGVRPINTMWVSCIYLTWYEYIKVSSIHLDFCHGAICHGAVVWRQGW